MSKICFQTMELLSQVQNASDFDRIVMGNWNPRSDSDKITAKEAAKLLASDYEQAQKLLKNLRLLHDASLGLESSQLLQLFPDSFPTNLKSLLIKFLSRCRSPDDVETETDSGAHRTMPSLVDVNWRVDTKLSSNAISRISVPTCLLQLKIQREKESCGSSTVHIELTKEAMDTMLDGLGKIRDQLSTISK